MPAPFFKTTQLEVAGGETEIFEIPAPPYGVLNRLWLSQITGALDGFSLSLYTSEKPAGDSQDDFSEAEDDDISAGAFEVLPTQIVSASSATLSLFEKNYAYVVNEYLLNGVLRHSKLFAKLVVAGSGDKAFELAYLIQPPAGEAF
jgi:hypothetical protein